LTGALAFETISAIQAVGVITSTKAGMLAPSITQSVANYYQHYIANEQETNRNPSGNVQSVSSNIDDRTMHEVYLW
jgi:Glycosyl hydrolase family 3 N terminal domain.